MNVKALVTKLVRRTIGAPGLWLGLGVVAIVAGSALSYHRSQIEADYALAMLAGPPNATPIEAATAARGAEVNVSARFDPSSAVMVKIGAPGERVERLAIPLFGLEDAKSIEAAEGQGELAPLRQARGLVVLPTNGLETLMGNAPAGVFEGTLNGPSIPVSTFALDTAAVLAEAGVTLPAEFVAVQPWLPSREAALAPRAASSWPGYLIWSGIAVIAFAFGLSLRLGDDEDEGRLLDIAAPKMREKSVTKSRIMADTDRFNPLVGQDDIRRGAMERLHASERAQGRTPSKFYTSGPANKVGGAWVKNRR